MILSSSQLLKLYYDSIIKQGFWTIVSYNFMFYNIIAIFIPLVVFKNNINFKNVV